MFPFLCRQRWVIALLPVALFLASPVRAFPPLDISGFASIGAGRVNDDQLGFLDYDGDWSMDSDSILGLQAIAPLSDRLSVTGQFVARGFNFDDDTHYKPKAEWLFVGYELTDELRVRSGRLRTPLYLFSEDLEVGYAYPWVRPPVDMYVLFLEPFSHFDGVDLTWNKAFGGVDAEFQAYAGNMQGNFLGIDIDIVRATGFSAKAMWSDITLRYSFVRNDTNVTLPGVEPAIAGFRLAASLDAGTFAGIDEYFSANRQDYDYHGLALQWERDAWSVVSEVFQFYGPEADWGFDARGGYVSVARQWGDLTPYYVRGFYDTEMRQEILDSISGTYAKYPVGVLPPLDELRSASLAALSSRTVGQRTHTLGLRWDFHSQADIKLEVQHFDFLKGSTGHMLPQPESYRPDSALLTSVIVDVVF